MCKYKYVCVHIYTNIYIYTYTSIYIYTNIHVYVLFCSVATLEESGNRACTPKKLKHKKGRCKSSMLAKQHQARAVILAIISVVILAPPVLRRVAWFIPTANAARHSGPRSLDETESE